MIPYSLIPDSVYSTLPENADDKFRVLAEVATREYFERLSIPQDQSYFGEASWRAQYVHEVTEIASELGISGLISATNALQNNETLAAWQAQLARILTRIKLRQGQESQTETVALTLVTREKLRAHLEELRQKVNASNLSDALKFSLHAKIDAVEAELDKKRSRLAPFVVLSGTLTLFATSVGTLADLSDAVTNVKEAMTWVRQDKTDEIEEEQRLHGAAPQLTDQRPHKSADADDDVAGS